MRRLLQGKLCGPGRGVGRGSPPAQLCLLAVALRGFRARPSPACRCLQGLDPLQPSACKARVAPPTEQQPAGRLYLLSRSLPDTQGLFHFPILLPRDHRHKEWLRHVLR